MPYVVHREGALQVGQGLAQWVDATWKSFRLRLHLPEPKCQLVLPCNRHWCPCQAMELPAGSTFLLFIHTPPVPSFFFLLFFLPFSYPNRFLLQKGRILGSGPCSSYTSSREKHLQPQSEQPRQEFETKLYPSEEILTGES